MNTSDPSSSVPASAAPQNTVLPTGVLTELMQSYLADRRSERRSRLIWRIVWLVLLVSMVWGVYERRAMEGTVSGAHTAMVDIRGVISEESDANADAIMGALREAYADEGAKAVVLRISSPGGSPVQAGLINDEIRRLKTLHGKKTYAVCEEMCASAAYYIAVAADQIVVNKASVVGSMGVLIDGFGFTGTMDKLGVERRLLTAGDNKGMLDPFSPLNEKHRAYAQAMIDQIHKQFIDVVRAGRGKRLKEDASTFSGLFWNGQKAVELGLADHLGSLDMVARDLVKAEDIIDYTPKPDWSDRLARRVGASVGSSLMQSLRWGATAVH